MRETAGGGGGTVVVDIGGVRAASGKVGEAGEIFGLLARRIASHPLPDMPGGTAAVVEAALSDAASMLAPLPEDLIAVAQELRVRALWAEIADRLMAGSGLSGNALKEFEAAYGSGLLTRYAEPWQKELADAYAKKLHDDAHPGGLLGVLHDVGSFFKGAYAAVKDTDLMIYHLSPYSSDPLKYWGQLGAGLAPGCDPPGRVRRADHRSAGAQGAWLLVLAREHVPGDRGDASVWWGGGCRPRRGDGHSHRQRWRGRSGA